MKIDFTGLDRIANRGNIRPTRSTLEDATSDFSEKSTKLPVSTIKGDISTLRATTGEIRDTATTDTTDTGTTENFLDAFKGFTLEDFKKADTNIIKSTRSTLEDTRSHFLSSNGEIYHETQKATVWGFKAPYNENAKKALINLQQEQENNRRIQEAYKRYQNNIRASESLQEDLLKGARAGEPIQLLFLKAIDCISKMTDNKLFYKQIREDLVKIYGNGLLDPIPIECELDETKKRLEKLMGYRARKDTTDGERIERAIEAHKAKIASLEESIREAEAEQEKKIAI